MGLTRKLIGGVGKLADSMSKFTDTSRAANDKIRNGKTWFSRPGEGISHSEFVPRVATARGAGVITAASLGLQFVSDVIHGVGEHSVGRVTYANGASKMTNSFTTGVVDAMQEASRGNFEIFSDMADDVLSSPNLISKIDDLGANPKMISALYNMSR